MANNIVRDGLRINDNIRIEVAGGTEYFYKVTARDTLFLSDTRASIASGAVQTYAEITNLNPPLGQLYQVNRIMTDSNIKVFVKQPAATNRWGTVRSPEGGYLTEEMSDISNTSGEYVNLWVIDEYPPNVQINNDTNVAIAPVLKWFGWRYTISKYPGKPEGPLTPIFIGGINQ